MPNQQFLKKYNYAKPNWKKAKETPDQGLYRLIHISYAIYSKSAILCSKSPA